MRTELVWLVAVGTMLGCGQGKSSESEGINSPPLSKSTDKPKPGKPKPDDEAMSVEPGIQKLATAFAAAADQDDLRKLFPTMEQVKGWTGCADTIMGQLKTQWDSFIDNATLTPRPLGDIVYSQSGEPKTQPIGSEFFGRCTSKTEVVLASVEFGGCKLQVWKAEGTWYVKKIIGRGCGSSQGTSKD